MNKHSPASSALSPSIFQEQTPDAKPLIQVLLATYNGERYLHEQIDSILGQSYANVSVLARDDASRDGTRAILEEYAARFPARFCLLPADEATGNAKWNFMRLMAASTAPYVALSDQDDVWRSEKLERSMGAMLQLEAEHASGLPCLVFTDLEVVDDELNTLHASFWMHQHIPAQRNNKVRYLLAQNVLTGCTALMNRSLTERALRMPEEAFMHDWWIALIATSLGAARALSFPSVRYRQHGANVVGAVEHKTPNMIPRWRYHDKRREQWEMCERQAEALLRTHGHELRPDQRTTIGRMILCETSPSRFTRVFSYLRGGFFQKGLRPNLAMLWYLWDMRAAKQDDSQ